MIISIIVILILLDQISKILIVNNLYEKSIKVIPNILNFTYVENRGASFGIGQDFTNGFIILNIIIIIVLGYFFIKNKDKFITFSKISYLSVMAGGIGNLIDRLVRGFVVDFIDINNLFEWPVFNIADIYIVLGCIGIMISIIFEKQNDGR